MVAESLGFFLPVASFLILIMQFAHIRSIRETCELFHDSRRLIWGRSLVTMLYYNTPVTAPYTSVFP